MPEPMIIVVVDAISEDVQSGRRSSAKDGALLGVQLYSTLQSMASVDNRMIFFGERWSDAHLAE
jgi:hypothetical protein